jgi:peroxiredoxin Q/BCP
MSLEAGKKAPGFTLQDGDGEKTSFSGLKGNWVVLYFYPKDDTQGCTTEALDFSRLSGEFEKLNAVVLGLSPDSVASHEKFTKKHDLAVRLLSDPDHIALEKYGVWQMKKMYGREYMGVVRTTILINPAGKIVEIWEKVRVKNHAEHVLEKLREMV